VRLSSGAFATKGLRSFAARLRGKSEESRPDIFEAEKHVKGFVTANHPKDANPEIGLMAPSLSIWAFLAQAFASESKAVQPSRIIVGGSLTMTGLSAGPDCFFWPRWGTLGPGKSLVFAYVRLKMRIYGFWKKKGPIGRGCRGTFYQKGRAQAWRAGRFFDI